MSWFPRIVALDVDGTIVSWENEASPSVVKAIHAIREAGAEIVISTGRAVPGVYDALGSIGLSDDGLAVASNGAVVFEVSPFRVARTVTFDAREAVKRVLEQVPDALVAVEEVGVGFRVTRDFPAGEINGRIIVEENLDSLIAEPVSRVVIRAPEHEASVFHDIVEDLGLEDTNYYVGYTAWLDLAPQGVSKASGLEYVCDVRGVDPADVLAVGDGNNDAEMLAWAGRGVAMGQAPDSLKAIADAVTGTVDDDGLAEELSRYL